MDAPATHPQLQAIFDLQYRASRNAIDVSFAMRRDRLLRMRNLLGKHAGELATAINADFGVRSRHLRNDGLEPMTTG